jgi:hypothetical protein
MEFKYHPLENIALDLIDNKGEIDVWDLGYELGFLHGDKFMKAYDIVASDILEALYIGKALTRRGNGNLKKPELANFFYSKSI